MQQGDEHYELLECFGKHAVKNLFAVYVDEFSLLHAKRRRSRYNELLRIEGEVTVRYNDDMVPIPSRRIIHPGRPPTYTSS
jgi:hypothetical protein